MHCTCLHELRSLRVLFTLRPTDIISCSSLKHMFTPDFVCTLKHLINNAIEYSLDDDFLLGRSPLAYNISFNIVVIETKFISLASSFYLSDIHLRTSTQIIHLLQPFALIFFPSIRTSEQGCILQWSMWSY
ncbi:unnamed protein product, partial [Vitis vinifera]